MRTRTLLQKWNGDVFLCNLVDMGLVLNEAMFHILVKERGLHIKE